MGISLLEQVVAGQAPSVLPLTVEQYHRMIEQRILREGEPTELIDGILIRKDRADAGGSPMSHGPRHSLTVKRSDRLLRVVEAHGCHLHVQLPVTLSINQEPEPDLGIVRGGPEDYQHRHPGPADVIALIEVADSSLAYDRTTKQRLYASAGISPYWIVNLVDNQIEVYQQPLPSEGRYATRTDFRPTQTIELILGPTQTIQIRVSDVLPTEPLV